MIYNDKIINNIVEKLFDTFIIKENTNVIVALSGGMDSMCLIDAMYKLKSEINYNLMAIHVNHGIRGDESNRDEAFVKEYCNDFNIKLIIKKVNAPNFAKKNNMTLEEAARYLRYNEFSKIIKKISTKNNLAYILTAHHKSDQVETIIHNIARGTGLKGLVGMNDERDYILRPLLNISKLEIEEYINNNSINYVNDSTNDDTNYTRNYIRHEILDKLNKLNDKFEDHLIDLSNKARQAISFIDKISLYIYDNIVISKESNIIVVDNTIFKKEHIVIKSSIIRIIFSEIINTLKDIGSVHINDIIELSMKEKGGHLDLPYNITVDKKQNKLIFTKNEKNISMSRRKK